MWLRLRGSSGHPRAGKKCRCRFRGLLDAHHIIIGQCRELAERANKLGDAGTNDLVVSDVLRANELQSWFLSEHLVDVPLVQADPTQVRRAG